VFSKKTIGYRLTSAIAFMGFLTISVGLIAVINWETLDDKIETIVNKNMPTLRASYQLERNTASLQGALNLLSHNTDPILHRNLKQNIFIKLELITAAITETASLDDYPAIKAEHAILASDINAYTVLLDQRNKHLLSLTATENSIKWLHQDLIDELTPLRQEVEWQLTRLLPNVINIHSITEIMTEFSLIQSITVKENELHQLVQEILLQRHERDISNAFYFIGYKIKEVNNMSKTLSHYPSTVSYRQLLNELIALVQPNGVLEKQLREDILLSNTINEYAERIQNRLHHQEELIQTMAEQATTSLKQLNDETRHSITISNFILFGVVFFAIFLSIVVSIYLVNRGIVKRLNLLSKALYDVANGNLNTEINVAGNDEIGMLGDNLQFFCQQMQEMQQSNALNLINNTQASIITCDLNGVVESVNTSALRLFNFDTSSKKNTIWNLFDKNMQQRLKSLFIASSPLLTKGACNLTLKQNTKEDSVYLRLDFRLFTQGNNDKIIITMTDITEQENAARWLENMVREKTLSLTNRNHQLKQEVEDRKRVENDLLAAQDDLIQATKMAVVGQTMTSLAHELNQPLSAISTHVFTAKMAVEKENYVRLPASLDKIDNLTARMGRIIASLRSFSRKQSANNPLVIVNIRDSINQSMLIVESRAKIQKTIITNTITQDLFASADQVQFEQVLVNLLVNSCDAVAGQEQREISVLSLLNNNKLLRIAVSDTGNGFDAEIIKKLFIPFTTTKDVGLGLGLSICRSIMNRLGGDIFLASTIKGGAMVVLELNNHDHE
jgi:two-component system, NtrC family, phosphoglycerate transport system sensor histidine kinase PgtB